MQEISRHRDDFLEALRAAFNEAVTSDPQRASLVEKWFAGLDRSLERATGEPIRLPACACLGMAVSRVEAHARIRGAPADPAQTGRASPATSVLLARALELLAPSLTWYRRIGSESQGPGFRDGHANALVLGSSRPEDRHRAAVGISLLTPDIRYPDHHHAPEELYLVLSPGQWRHGRSSWFEPGIGGVVHNTPDIVHAMQSGAEPLLAIWCLLPADR